MGRTAASLYIGSRNRCLLLVEHPDRAARTLNPFRYGLPSFVGLSSLSPASFMADSSDWRPSIGRPRRRKR